MPILYRRDEELVDHMGNPLSGVAITVYSQPANTLVQLYADSKGNIPLTNPPQTNAYGMVSYYLPAGLYTVSYYSTQIAGQTIKLPDQVVTPPYSNNGIAYNDDSSTNGSIIPNPDGLVTTFFLAGIPNPPSTLVLMVNGLVQLSYAFSGSTVIFPTAPQAGDVITARYQVQD